MPDRIPIDHLTSDALDALYEQLEAAEETEAQRQLTVAQAAFASATMRAARADAAIARVRALAERWRYTSDRKHGPLTELLRALDETGPETAARPEPAPPSRLAGLRDEIAAAVMPVLYREWPWLRAEAEEAAIQATEPATITDLERQLDALRQVARGYCPHCGRGDAAPTATDWEQQKHRADQAEATLDQARRLREDLAGITGARWIADALDHILNPTTATEATRPPTGKRDNQTTRSTGGQS